MRSSIDTLGPNHDGKVMLKLVRWASTTNSSGWAAQTSALRGTPWASVSGDDVRVLAGPSGAVSQPLALAQYRELRDRALDSLEQNGRYPPELIAKLRVGNDP
jgi:hypothetical protein